MSNIVDVFGQPINGKPAKERPITKSQAGAIITSEIDVAILNWNKHAAEQHKADPTKAHTFEIKFDRYEYAQEIKDKMNWFGYCKLSIVCIHENKPVTIYDKGKNFTKESELDNTNGYYPDLIIDCLGFLIASGLMYNLAISKPETRIKEPEHATKVKVNKPRNPAKSKPGNGNTAGSN